MNMAASVSSTSNKRIGWHGGIENFSGACHTRYRQLLRIEQPELDEHRGLVPINMLVIQLAVPEAHDYDQGDFDSPTSRRDTGQHPIHFDAVGEFDDHLIDKLVGPDRAGNGGSFPYRAASSG